MALASQTHHDAGTRTLALDFLGDIARRLKRDSLNSSLVVTLELLSREKVRTSEIYVAIAWCRDSRDCIHLGCLVLTNRLNYSITAAIRR